MTFDDLVSGGIVALEKAVTEQLEENYQLEFKQKQNPCDLELHKDDRRALGEALSGFANAVGGTLVIGVRTERPNGVDRASELKPIQNVAAVADRYRSYINDCVSPQIKGIRVAALNGEGGWGAIVIDVPQGDARPHMSMAPSHQRYYRRVADGFVPMLHYEVDEMMRIKLAPQLSLIHQLRGAGSIGANRNFVLRFGLRNISGVTARFPYISYKHKPNQPRVARYGLDGNGRTLWPNLSIGSDDAVFAAGSDQVLHPDQEFYVSQLEFDEHWEPRFGRAWGVSELSEGENLILRFEFGCEDCPKTLVELSFTRAQLLGST